MQVEKIPLEKVVLDPANARTHGTKNLESIKGSLARFGQRTPIVVDKNNVVRKGNGTVLAARALGWTDVFAVRAEDMSDADLTAYAIADNRTGELATWDPKVLQAQLETLAKDKWPIETIGFDAADMAKLQAVVGQTQPASAAEWSNSMGGVDKGERAPIQQMTFTLHDDQVEAVKAAIEKAKAAGPFVDTGNENSNGNALARICEAYLG